MKKKLAVFFAIFFVAAVSIQCDFEKMKINHKGKVIEISVNAWEAHKAHGDTFICFVW